MEITSASTVRLKIPFSDGGAGVGLFPTKWSSLDFVLLKLETSDGITGWGEAFSYFCAESVDALLNRSLLPLLPGLDPLDIEGVMQNLQHKVHIIGRYGITMFALSAVDLALWDIKAKSQGAPLAKLLGGRRRDKVPAYASLVRYGDAGLVARLSERAAEEGYGTIKLHEITRPEVAAARRAVGSDLAISTDVNCNWSLPQTMDMLPVLAQLDFAWLEEPVFPPEDYETLARLRNNGVPIACGENACTQWQFRELISAGAADIVQPSITKLGGISEYLGVETLASEAGLTLTPHSPYFGPGYLATLQMMAVSQHEQLFEYLYIDREASVYADLPVPENGHVYIPDGPGLGMDPDLDVLERFSV